MKKITVLLFMSLVVFSCKKEKIVIEGYLVDERDDWHFNPFSNATLRVVLDQGYGYSTEIGSTVVGSDGYYEVTVKAKPGVTERLQLHAEENTPQYMDANVTLKAKTNFDFIIPCRAKLNRVFFNQTATSFDSIVTHVTNPMRTNKYINYVYAVYSNFNEIQLQGGVNNYLISDIYANGLYSERFDTINPGCKTTINDTIIY